jgi:hypothetical protein
MAGSKPAGQFALRHRVIEVVRHVLLASPALLPTKAWSASRPSLSMSAIMALLTFALGPSFQTIGSAARSPAIRFPERRVGFRHEGNEALNSQSRAIPGRGLVIVLQRC